MVEVIPGAEPWSVEGGETGVLVLHGLTGNPVSMRPLAEAFADAGHAVELPRLPGHGTTWQDCQTTTWRDWVREATAALDALVARTRARVVVGQSVGGALALHLAETRGDDLAGVAVINPLLHSSDKRLVALPLLKRLVPSFPGVTNDIAKPGADEKGYDRLPLKALASSFELQKMVRQNLPAVTIPVLQLTSRQDHIVEPANAKIVLAGISSTDVDQVWLERSYHVATLDYDADLIIERVLAFIDRVTAP